MAQLGMETKMKSERKLGTLGVIVLSFVSWWQLC